MVPVPVEHQILAVMLHDEGGLKSSFGFSKAGVGFHGDPHGLPVFVRELGALPAIEEACLPRRGRTSDARPQLPRPVGGLPHGEIDGLLFRFGVFAKIGIAGHLPELSIDLWHEHGFACRQERDRARQQQPGGHRAFVHGHRHSRIETTRAKICLRPPGKACLPL